METQTTLRDTIEKSYDAAVPEVVETPLETKVETPAEKTAEQLRKDDTGRLHAADGKFATKEKEEEKPEVTRPPRPSSWKKDYEKDWETLDPRLASYINQRESEYAKGVSTYKTEWDRAKPILEAITPYQGMLQQTNLSRS